MPLEHTPEPESSARSGAVEALTPRPRIAAGSGTLVPFDGLVLHVGAGCTRAGQALTEALALSAQGRVGSASPLTVSLTADADLPAEGYTLTTNRCATTVTIRAADPAGAFYGAQTLAALAGEHPGHIPDLTIKDWPELRWRGTVEGFYGPPWAHAERLDHLRFAGRHKLNHFVYAPKDDLYHRDRWREPYPTAELSLLAELVQTARSQHVRFVYALSPGLSMRYSDPDEHERLRAKTEQLWDIGIRDFALLFDDIPAELSHQEDRAMFGDQPGAAGAAHGYTCAQFVEHFLAPRAVDEPLLMVPTDYAGTTPSPYREQLAATLPTDALVWWTGPDIVVGDITRQHIDDAAASYRRRLLIWDNFPVNDFDRTRLFLGPLTGRATALKGAALAGISANPMIEAAASQLALISVADYAWHPEGYDASGSAARALRAAAGPDAKALAPLVRTCSTWPPSAPQDARLVGLIESALGPDLDAARAAAHGVRDGLADLAQAPGTVSGESALLAQIEPWMAAGAEMAQAGRLAAELLLRLQDGSETGDLPERTQTALESAEQHYPNVLRDIIPRFVRAVLRRGHLATTSDAGPLGRPDAGTDADGAGGAAPWVLLVTAAEPGAGEETLATRLRSRGLIVRFSTTGDFTEHDPDNPPSLIVLTHSADPQGAVVAGRTPVPLLAWAHLVQTGLATDSGTLLTEDRLNIVAAQDPLAAGLSGRQVVYRGLGKVTWAEPGTEATVVARASNDRPATFRYRAGAALADGSVAPAPRIVTFLGSAGLAPWLLTDAGLALVDATVAELTLATPVADVAGPRAD